MQIVKHQERIYDYLSLSDQMILLDEDWTEEQAKGLLDQLTLTGGAPDWKPEHLQKLHDWCSAHGKDHKTLEGQLDFIAYELLNSYEGIGRALKQTETVGEARRAVEPYVKILREDREWFRTLQALQAQQKRA